ncbi:kinase domain-containing protein [Lasiosphaeria ovina]|uniref:Kinase domain-containing protein n=1 Tax=Lasiosphaeria ovina TaxID=92902 RepID=A0AAE0K525_9PEZI|nr:kinase domain-containing protein [Lasiosphaeria ovina]
MQEQDVLYELARCLPLTLPDSLRKYAKEICSGPGAKGPPYKKIFAILVLIEKAASIVEFMDEGLHDGCLPLPKVPLDLVGNTSGWAFTFVRKDEGKNAIQRLQSFQGFSRMNHKNFDACQWALLAPIFRRPHRQDVQLEYLHSQAILPFSEEEEVAQGGYGEVSRVVIHPDNHDFNTHTTPTPSSNQFAIKRLKQFDERPFRAEFDMLSNFSEDAHSHLISLLAAYQQHNSFHLIFPWAEADLLRFWMEIRPKPDFNKTVRWMSAQCSGLADGLSMIHRYGSFGLQRRDGKHMRSGIKLYGRHGDIKPANVLWFPDLGSAGGDEDGVLKLTDFGLAELHSLDSRSAIPKSQVATSMSYRPPECDIPEQKICRLYDIWALGCLYLEFVVWLLGGWDLLKVFAINRMGKLPNPAISLLEEDFSFFELIEGGRSARVKRSVTEFIRNKLHGNPKCSAYIHEFLDLIEQHMLVIETRDADGRIDCGQLNARLVAMHQRCKKDEIYALKPVLTKST